MITTFQMGRPRIRWENQPGRANEPLDLNVYSYAALKLINPVWEALEELIPTENNQYPVIPQPNQKGRRMGSKGIQL